MPVLMYFLSSVQLFSDCFSPYLTTHVTSIKIKLQKTDMKSIKILFVQSNNQTRCNINALSFLRSLIKSSKFYLEGN